MKDPMNLKDLPEYLKSIKENNSYGENVVVDMGQVVDPVRKTNFFLIGLLFLVFSLTGITYYNFSKNTETIILSSNSNDLKFISQVASEAGIEIVSIKQKDNETFEIKFNKPKDLNSFLEKLRKNKQLKKIEIKKD